MCDTVVALGKTTADGVTIFGKNSNREPNEAHHLLRIPRAHHPPGSTIKCTYIEVPQVEQTFEVLLAKPFWIWGAEMGANEHGVAIGNEAVFTKVPYGKSPGLIGMDLLRLALERSRTAREALDVITSLLSGHGQGGNCGLKHKMTYHNSFLCADPNDAWVLETAGPHWAAEQVKDVRTISNRISIGDRWDLASDDLVNYAVERGWCKGRDDFHFGRCYSDFLYTTFSKSKDRQCRTTDLLAPYKGEIMVDTVLRALCDHGPEAGGNVGHSWNPGQGLTDCSVCMHVGFGPVRVSQTTGSMVSHLAPDVQTHYVTGTAAPCTSIFKPVWLGTDRPDTGPIPTDVYDEATLFWRHETLHRATLRDYVTRSALYREQRVALQHRFIEGAEACRDRPLVERAAYSSWCFREAREAEARWTDRVLDKEISQRSGLLYSFAWRGFNRAANMPDLR
jgi:dipeptidase